MAQSSSAAVVGGFCGGVGFAECFGDRFATGPYSGLAEAGPERGSFAKLG